MALFQSALSNSSDISLHPRKKLKTSDLPLSAEQRSAIENLLHTYKKRGGFDAIRKQVWATFLESEAKKKFTTALTELAESEIDRDSSLLSRERGKAATLIEGAVDRSSIYKTVESDLDALIAGHLDSALTAIREIRKNEVGEEIALEEEKRGEKTDADYEREFEKKRQERERDRLRLEELQRQIEEGKARIRAEERKKAERLREEARKAEEKRREERRNAERAKRLEEERLREERREKERQERRRREEEERKRRREERSRARERERERERGRRRNRDSRDRYRRSLPLPPTSSQKRPRSRSPNEAAKDSASTVTAVPPVDEAALEKAALELLLKEGQEMKAKSQKRNTFNFEATDEDEVCVDGTRPSDTHPKQEASRSKADSKEARRSDWGDDYRSRERDKLKDKERDRDYESRKNYTHSRHRSRSRSQALSRERDKGHDKEDRRHVSPIISHSHVHHDNRTSHRHRHAHSPSPIRDKSNASLPSGSSSLPVKVNRTSELAPSKPEESSNLGTKVNSQVLDLESGEIREKDDGNSMKPPELPSTSKVRNSGRSRSRERRRDSLASRELRSSYSRSSDHDRERERERDRRSHRNHSRERDRGRYHDRYSRHTNHSRSRNRGQSYRSRENKRHYSRSRSNTAKRDRYIPQSKLDEERRLEDRDRDREKGRDRDERRREVDDRDDRVKPKGWVEIDRYVPGTRK